MATAHDTKAPSAADDEHSADCASQCVNTSTTVKRVHFPFDPVCQRSVARAAHGQQRQSRHFFNIAAFADTVVKACAWSDGGAEFVYGDGSVLSFCDAMHTFVALRFRHPQDGAGGVASQDDGCAEVEKDMLFTAWTLSAYTAKVKAALALYNRYAAHPRLIAGLTSEPVQPWTARSPMDVLILAKDPQLLQRRVVRARVSAAAASVCTAVNERSPTTCDGGAVSTRDVMAPGVVDSDEVAKVEVILGTEVTLWCALRRVSLTVHVNRATFAVRWPAPVTQADGSRSVFLPSGDLLADAIPTDGNDASLFGLPRLATQRATPFVWLVQVFPIAQPPAEWAEMLALALELDAEAPSEAPCEPNPVEEKKKANEPSSSHGAPQIGDPAGLVDTTGTLYRSLPVPVSWTSARAATSMTTSSPLQPPCRFSSIQPAHLHYLLAAGTHLQRASCNRAIHGDTAKVLWRYDADCTGREPSALYWCLDGLSDLATASTTATSFVSTTVAAPHAGAFVSREDEEEEGFHNPSHSRSATTCGGGGAVHGAVLGVVVEDGSVVHVQPRGTGYVLQHRRCDGHIARYHLSAEGDITLPPVLGPLRFRQYSFSVADGRQCGGGVTEWSLSALDGMRHAASDNSTCLSTKRKPYDGVLSSNGEGGQKTASTANSSLALLVHSEDLAPATTISLPAPTPSSTEATLSQSEVSCVFAPGLATQSVACAASSSPSSSSPFVPMAAARDRYLTAVGDSSVQLSQWNLSANRIAEHHRRALLQPDPLTLEVRSPALWGQIDSDAHGAARGSTVSTTGIPSSMLPPFASATAKSAAPLELRPHPLTAEPDALLAACVDGSAYRNVKGHPPALVEAAHDGGVVFLSSRLDQIGTFTALTNGTIRCAFDDRTLLTLVPGLNDFDEEYLVATCLYRDATRCTIRAVQCTQDHPMYRYLAYALPFRRFVLMEATSRLATKSTATAKADVLGERETNTLQAVHAGHKTAEGDHGGNGGDSAPQLLLTSWAETELRTALDAHALQEAMQQRVEALLNTSDALSQANRSLLQDDGW